MGHTLRHQPGRERQLRLQDTWGCRLRDRRDAVARMAPVCAGCRAREARYGFRDDRDDPTLDRPQTLCFECFRIEVSRRQAMAARMARGWNAQQVRLPLEETLRELTHRRRRAQIAARRAVGE